MELHVIEHEGRETVVLLDNEMRIVKPVEVICVPIGSFLMIVDMSMTRLLQR